MSIVVETCPRCGGHLEDTWDGDACGRCGFAYVHVDETKAPTHRDPSRQLKQTMAGAFAIMAAALSGAAVADSSMVTSVPTETGVEAIAFAPPDSSFWFAGGLLLVAVLLLTYSTYEPAGGVR